MKDYLRIILILVGLFTLISCIYSVISIENIHIEQFNNRINELPENKISIIIPSVYRKDKNYINETLSELYKQKQPSTKLNIFIHIGDHKKTKTNVNANSKNDIAFYIHDKFKRNSNINILKTYKEEYGNLLNKHTYKKGKDYMFWRSKQNLDYYFAITKTLSRTNAPYILFLEDDQKAVHNWDMEINKNIESMETNNKICHTKMSPLGMCAYLYNSTHMRDFANYMKDKYDKNPCDWLIKHFVREKSLKIKKAPKYVFQHEGDVSSLVNKTQMLKVKNLN